MDYPFLASVVFLVTILATLVVALYLAARHHREVLPWLRVAYPVALLGLAFESAFLVAWWIEEPVRLQLGFEDQFLYQSTLVFLAAKAPMQFAGLLLLTAVGLYLGARRGTPSMPLLAPEPNAESLGPVRRPWIRTVLLATVGITVGSFLLFAITQPQLSGRMSPILRLLPLLSRENPAGGAAMLVLLALSAPIWEEVLFRLVLQTLIEGRDAAGRRGLRGALALALPAAVWACAHAGTLDPEWTKFVQIFGIGIVLGVVFRRCGLEACWVVHGGFNLLGALVFQPLTP